MALPITLWEICWEYSQILCHINQLDALKNNIKSNYFWDGFYVSSAIETFSNKSPALNNWRWLEIGRYTIKGRSQLTPCAIKCIQWENFWKFERWWCWGRGCDEESGLLSWYSDTLYLRNCQPQSHITNTPHPLLYC